MTRATDIDNVQLKKSSKKYKKAQHIKLGFKKTVTYVHAVIFHRKTLWPVMNHINQRQTCSLIADYEH